MVGACQREVRAIGEQALELEGIAEPVAVVAISWDDDVP